MTTPDAGEDELTALYDADFPRVDLVGKGANGIPRFLIAKQDNDSAGLLEPDFVRDLIAKAEPDPSGRERVAMPSGVTLSGSPADIAAFIHKAAQRAEPEDVAKAEMKSAAINDLPDSMFGYIEPGGTKDESGKTTPRSKRHFPLPDKAHADNAAARIAQGAEFGDKAKAKVEAAQRKFGEKVSKEAAVADQVTKDAGDVLDAQLDDGIDGMDPTVPLAAPDEDAPGDPTDPGSPAWEAIDAATACKWTSILSRARVAIDLLGEREMLEAASADPDDQENAWDMQDVCCAIDYAISVLAPYAVAEQSEADTGTDAMEMIGKVRKAMAGFDGVPMDRLEALSAVAKAGRVLSAKNESEIRSAAASLQNVLTSLPAAPMADDSGQPVAKQKEAAMAADQTAPAAEGTETVAKADSGDQARDTGPVNAGGTTGLGQPRATGPDGALPADGPQASLPGDVPGRTVIKAAARLPVVATVQYIRDGVLCTGHVDPAAIAEPVAKADADTGADGDDGKQLQAVFDQDGQLIGVVDPAAIQPVSGAGKPAPKDDGTAAAEDGKPAEPAVGAKDGAADMTPAPPADAGTPADGSGDDDEVAKQDAGRRDGTTDVRNVLKSIVAEAVSAALEARAPAEDIAKGDVAGLGSKLEDVLVRLAKVEEQPAAPKVFTNGQTPPANQLRGQDQGALPHVDVAKARVRKQELYSADAPDQARIAREMQQEAIDRLALMHASPRADLR